MSPIQFLTSYIYIYKIILTISFVHPMESAQTGHFLATTTRSYYRNHVNKLIWQKETSTGEVQVLCWNLFTRFSNAKRESDKGVILDLPEPTRVCIFPICITGDMPQQQMNAGFKFPNMQTTCSKRLSSGKGWPGRMLRYCLFPYAS